MRAYSEIPPDDVWIRPKPFRPGVVQQDDHIGLWIGLIRFQTSAQQRPHSKSAAKVALHIRAPEKLTKFVKRLAVRIDRQALSNNPDSSLQSSKSGQEMFLPTSRTSRGPWSPCSSLHSATRRSGSS